MTMILVVCFAVLVALAVLVYLMPTEQKQAQKKKREEKRQQLMPDPANVAKQKDWEAIAQRWEKQNNALLGDLEKLKGQYRSYEKEIEQLKAQNKEQLEKLTLEKSWREKEQATMDKSKIHEKELKDQILRTESDLEKEHSARLRMERELQDLKIKFDEVNEEKRQATVKAMSLQTTLNETAKELRELKSKNVELSRKREDIQWIAKSEFEEVKAQLTKAQQEIERLKSNG